MSVARGGQILMSAVTASLAAGVPGVELRPVGSRHLRGVSEPVDVVVVLAAGVDLNATPPPVDVVEGNLPRPVTEYVGDLAELRRRVGGLSGRRLVTLTGSGGVGKTRTAIEIGWLSSDQFPGGVWLVELAPVGCRRRGARRGGGDVGGAAPTGVDDDRVDRGLVAVPPDAADLGQLRTRLGPRRAAGGRHRSGRAGSDGAGHQPRTVGPARRGGAAGAVAGSGHRRGAAVRRTGRRGVGWVRARRRRTGR